MLKKYSKYFNTLENTYYEVVDYIYYKGTKEHGFTFKIGTELKKITVKDSNLDIYLTNFEIKNENMDKNYIQETKDILLETIKDLKNDKIEINRANGISKTAQTIINILKLEHQMKDFN
jgi:hypothetical protein